MNMKCILYQWTIVLCFLVAQLTVRAQTSQPSIIPTVFSKSPNSAALAKYGDYPVNLYSGLPDISIPLYTVESGGVAGAYHAILPCIGLKG